MSSTDLQRNHVLSQSWYARPNAVRLLSCRALKGRWQGSVEHCVQEIRMSASMSLPTIPLFINGQKVVPSNATTYDVTNRATSQARLLMQFCFVSRLVGQHKLKLCFMATLTTARHTGKSTRRRAERGTRFTRGLWTTRIRNHCNPSVGKFGVSP